MPYLLRSEKDTEPSGTGITDDWVSMWVLGIKTGLLQNQLTGSLKFWAISPAFVICFIVVEKADFFFANSGIWQDNP